MTVPDPNMTTSVSETIFREYDIRGKASPSSDSDEIVLTPRVARLIGHALGSRHRSGERALVTGDNRVSTPGLRLGVAAGLNDAGLSVDLAVEEIPTGAASWLALTNRWATVIQVTGSHTPPHFNGLKITERQKDGHPSDDADAVPSAVFGRSLTSLRHSVLSHEGAVAPRPGDITDLHGLVERYQAALVTAGRQFLSTRQFLHPRRVVLDAGNGLGACLKGVLESLGVEVDGLFLESDGTFPNHPADPLLARKDAPYSNSGVRYTCERVALLNRHHDSGPRWIGIITDGDGDRSGVVDELGDPVRPELVGFLFYLRYLEQNRSGLQLLEAINQRILIAADIRATGAFGELLAAYPAIEGRFIPAGYPIHRSFAKTQIRRLMALADVVPEKSRPAMEALARNYLSAEVSGHYFFNIESTLPDVVVDDGLLAALRLLEIVDTYQGSESLVSGKDMPLRKLVAGLPSRQTSEEIRLHCADERKFAIVNEIKEAATTRFSGDIRPRRAIETIDDIPMQPLDAGLIEVDGIRVQFRDESLFLVRASNTSPALTFRFEGLTAEALAARRQNVVELLEPYRNYVADIDSLLTD